MSESFLTGIEALSGAVTITVGMVPPVAGIVTT